ncbi:uncharacterized protein NEMAJ01_2416, partial [Nematocida major]|uniref:uncharacterized protein n=1 Tax=Nematocida major TaxID=1912982 RepID=UPI002008AF92
KLGAVSAEILLEVPEEELQEVISASETLREKVLEYVAQQPKYIQSKHKAVTGRLKRMKSPKQ